MTKFPSLGMCRIKDMHPVIHLLRPVPWLSLFVSKQCGSPQTVCPTCDLTREESKPGLCICINLSVYMCVHVCPQTDAIEPPTGSINERAWRCIHASALMREAAAGGLLSSGLQAQPGLHSSWTARVNRCVNDVTDVRAFVPSCISVQKRSLLHSFFQEPLQHGPALICMDMLDSRLTHWQPQVEMHKEAPDLRQLSGQLPPHLLPVL